MIDRMSHEGGSRGGSDVLRASAAGPSPPWDQRTGSARRAPAAWSASHLPFGIGVAQFEDAEQGIDGGDVVALSRSMIVDVKRSASTGARGSLRSGGVRRG